MDKLREEWEKMKSEIEYKDKQIENFNKEKERSVNKPKPRITDIQNNK